MCWYKISISIQVRLTLRGVWEKHGGLGSFTRDLGWGACSQLEDFFSEDKTSV